MSTNNNIENISSQPVDLKTFLPSRLDYIYFFQYAKHVALLTLVTAYLGKLAKEKTFCISIPTMGFHDHMLGNLKSFSHWIFIAALLAPVVFKWLLKYAGRHMTRIKTVTQATSNQALSKIRSSTSLMFMSSPSSNENLSRSDLISGQKSFIPDPVILRMTLKDQADVWAYCMKMNQLDFDRDSFLLEVRPAARSVIYAVEEVLKRWCGADCQFSQVETHSVGSMDALAYIAAVRVTAEWRLVRMVPDGYPAFAMGAKLGRRDLLKNAGKVELAVKKWVESRIPADGSSCRISTPTLRQLLQGEKDSKVHKKLPVLTDQSAANGLLWTKRLVQTQALFYDKMHRVPGDFPNYTAAAKAAYYETYGDYLGFWAMQFTMSSLNASPPDEDFLRHLNAPYLDDSGSETATLSDDESTLGTSLNSGASTISQRSVPSDGFDFEEKWHEIVAFFSQCGGHNAAVDEARNAIFIPEVAKVSSEKTTSFHLRDARHLCDATFPLIDGVHNLLVDLNMNDTSRV